MAPICCKQFFFLVEMIGARGPFNSTVSKYLFATYWAHRRLFLPPFAVVQFFVPPLYRHLGAVEPTTPSLNLQGCGTKKLDDRKRGQKRPPAHSICCKQIFRHCRMEEAPCLYHPVKKKCLQPSLQRYPLFLPPLGVIFGGSHFGWAPQNVMVSYFVPPL